MMFSATAVLALLPVMLIMTSADPDTLYFRPVSKLSKKEPASAETVSSTLKEVVCKDSRYRCPDGTTCCPISTGYGCCPYPSAVCCKDNSTCCPDGYTCDDQKKTCVKGPLSINKGHKFDARFQAATPEPNKKCPDKKGSCPRSATCCKLQTGDYGCCPIQHAVCCSDHEHCCPENHKCDVAAGTCLSSEGQAIDWVTKVAAMPIMVTPVKKGVNKACPGGGIVCPDSSTCCQLASGQYGCCPYQNADCCSDHLHCCPEGMKCDVAKEMCRQDDGSEQPWGTKLTAKPAQTEDATCPDMTSCSVGTTCCQMDDGGNYGCCPMTDGVCCQDKQHCCPKGMTCNLGHGTCEWNGHTRTYTALPVFQPTPTGKASSNDDINCPDKKSTCPSGTTCCQMQSGWYGCCPMLNAVCCSDHLHCCQKGETCDVEKGLCKDGDKETPWHQKQMATPAPDTKDVKCDDQYSCTDGTTCCKQGDTYACCPMPKAVCCDDQIHCCPSGYTCDTKQGTCTRGYEVISMTSKIFVEPVPPTPVYLIAGQSPKSEDIKCPDGSTCEDTSTCCAISSSAYACCPMKEADKVVEEKTSTVLCPDHRTVCPSGNTCCGITGGQYGCCPFPEATCCSDETNCCPHDYTCTTSSCIQSDDEAISVPWKAIIPATVRPQPDSNVVCPDKKTQCPSGATCCPIDPSGYGCCPFENADKVVEEKTSVVLCPDHRHECPPDTTCCLLTSGYGCCPFPEATCCSDKINCCPHDYTCTTTSCIESDNEAISVPWKAKIPATVRPQPDSNVVCPDKKTQCPSGATCCPIDPSGYGCCPFENAVCCSDHLHCCPNGETCDVSQGMCKSGDLETPWQEKQIASAVDQPSDVQCDDPTYSCPDETTCCKQGDEYACCPMPKAVCCKDQVHCCPNGYKCGEQKCTKGDDVLLFTKITSAITDSSSPVTVLAAAMFSNVKCGDGSECPADTTCCKISESQYGCCPMPKAVCCSDNIHCCPNGYTCDTEGGRCNKGEATNVVLTKISVDEKTADDMCPDKNSSCPTGTTCCKMISGGYGCCAFPKAVCCNDKIHCCPENYKCGGDSCQKEDNSADVVPWKSKIAATVREVTNDVVCPDKKTKCQSGQTCCALGSGYGCCPMKKAVCCADKIHCCPNGYKCEVGTGACTKSTEYMHSIPWSEKVPALPETAGPDNNMCPDQKTSCDSGTTCCKMSSGGYGCCPYEKAVCCSDGLHCCPAGMTCDVAAGKCNSGTNSLTFTWDSLSQPEKVVPQSKLQAVKCKDGNECPWGQTCCELASGKYGCCPLPNATCCSDKIHCCPTDSKCDTTEGKCVSKTNSLSVSWNAISTTTQPIESTLVPCDDGSKCPDDTTCCEIGGGKYGCCPFVKAVCCSDHSHCCPHGMTCDVAQGRCASSLPFDTSIPAHTMEAAEPVNAVICPDHQHECPDHTTCCLMADRLWGCCPFPQAICCADHEHCCPPGYTCEPRQGICQRRRPPSVTTQQLPIHPAPLSRKPDQ